MNERADQAELLLHSAGELAGQPLAKLAHSRGLKQLNGTFFAPCPLHSKQVCIKTDVFIHSQVFIQPKPLRHITKRVLGALGIARYIESRDRGFARIGRHNAR